MANGRLEDHCRDLLAGDETELQVVVILQRQVFAGGSRACYPGATAPRGHDAAHVVQLAAHFQFAYRVEIDLKRVDLVAARPGEPHVGTQQHRCQLDTDQGIQRNVDRADHALAFQGHDCDVTIAEDEHTLWRQSPAKRQIAKPANAPHREFLRRAKDDPVNGLLCQPPEFITVHGGQLLGRVHHFQKPIYGLAHDISSAVNSTGLPAERRIKTTTWHTGSEEYSYSRPPRGAHARP